MTSKIDSMRNWLDKSEKQPSLNKSEFDKIKKEAVKISESRLKELSMDV